MAGKKIDRKFFQGAVGSATKDHFSRLRINLLFFVLLFIGGAIIVRLYSLQVLSYSSYKALSENQHSILKSLVPSRGEIFLSDKSGEYPLAVNRESKLAFAVPEEIEDLESAVDFVSSSLGLDRDEVRNKLDRPGDMYEVLKHRLSDDETKTIQERKMAGIRLLDEPYRYYPGGELAANVVGFVGWSGDDFGGKYGIERKFEKELKGDVGKMFQNKDASGRWITIGERSLEPAEDGKDIVLTIDHIVQFEAEKILRGAMEKYEAEGGTIVVMEPESGKILALANYPTFDPNEYSKVEDMSAFRNLAVNDAYEPGSVFKTFTLAAALDSGKITPDTTYVDTGVVHEAGFDIKNSDYKSYGLQTMTQVLENSLNTGVIFAERLVGNKNFSDYVKRFGFGDLTGIDLFGETPGRINNLDNLNSDIQFFTASFGQGITVTPIQLAAAYSAIANGGRLMKPQIIEKKVDSSGKEEYQEPQEIRRVISPKASLEAMKMLVSVVENGHGKRAGVPGYLVGGKTGTAQVASQDKKGYEEGKNIGSFAGLAPADDPKFVIVVRMDDPKAVEWAESSAAPTFGELMKFLLEYYNIEPTEEYTQKDLDEFAATHNLKEFILRKEKEEKAEAEEADGNNDSGGNQEENR